MQATQSPRVDQSAKATCVKLFPSDWEAFRTLMRERGMSGSEGLRMLMAEALEQAERP